MTDTPSTPPPAAAAPAAAPSPPAAPKTGHLITDPGDASPIGWHDGVADVPTDLEYRQGPIDPVSGMPTIELQRVPRPYGK